MLSDILTIIGQVLLPVIFIAVLGAMLQRFKPLDLKTLVAVCIYIFVPAFVFLRVLDSSVSPAEVVRMGVVVLGSMAAVGVIMWVYFWWRSESLPTTSTALVAGMFFNAANLGIPVAELAFGERGGNVQPLIMMFVGMSTFIFGYTLLARGQGKGWMVAVGAFLRLPYVYAILLGVLMRSFDIELPTAIRGSLGRIADGMIPVALFTLGAQIAQQARWPKWRVIAPVLIAKLILMPLITAVFVFFMGMWPWPGQLLVLAAAAPSAVNTLLISIEVDGDAELAADCVFWTTLVCIFTLPVALAIIHAIG